MNQTFKQLDLNLLKVLKVLIEVQNTRKASELLFTSQPSVSRSLQKLREHFKDELFIRSQHGLEPTAKLLEIKQSLVPALLQLESALEPDPVFIPEKMDDTINIAINGFIANSISEKLIQRLFLDAPNIKVNIHEWGKQTHEHLISGEVDLGINYYPLELSKQVYQKQLTKDGFIFVCRAGHPLANQTLNNYQGEPLLLVSLVIPNWNDNGALAPAVLANAGIRSVVKVRSNYLHSLLAIVKESDMLFPCSRLLSESLTDDFALVDFPEYPTMPVSDVGISIGRKHRNQPKANWLQTCVEEVFKM